MFVWKVEDELEEVASLIASFPHMLHSDSKGLSLTRQLLRSTHLFAPKIHNVLAVKVVC